MGKEVSLAIVVGAAFIAAAIYLKPSEFDRCVDRRLKTAEPYQGNMDEWIEGQSVTFREAFASRFAEECSK